MGKLISVFSSIDTQHGEHLRWILLFTSDSYLVAQSIALIGNRKIKIITVAYPALEDRIHTDEVLGNGRHEIPNSVITCWMIKYSFWLQRETKKALWRD